MLVTAGGGGKPRGTIFVNATACPATRPALAGSRAGPGPVERRVSGATGRAIIARGLLFLTAGGISWHELPMTNRRGIADLKEHGAGRAAPAEVVLLYRQAFEDFGATMLWSRRAGAAPTIGQALVIAEALRREGNMRSRPLAAQIEEACRAALQLTE